MNQQSYRFNAVYLSWEQLATIDVALQDQVIQLTQEAKNLREPNAQAHPHASVRRELVERQLRRVHPVAALIRQEVEARIRAGLDQ